MTSSGVEVEINVDESVLVVKETQAMDWSASPSPLVFRKRLALEGTAELGRVTSVVKFEAGASFKLHDHPQGEEIIVLDGVFSDHSGNFGKGSYLLNCEGYKHAPESKEGCLLFVKLRQYGGEGREFVAHQTDGLEYKAVRDGVEEKVLFNDPKFPDSMAFIRLRSNAEYVISADKSVSEIFVLSGNVVFDSKQYGEHTWVRFPKGTTTTVRGGDSDCEFYIKNGQWR